MSFCNFCKSSPKQNIFVSPANSTKCNNLVIFHISLIYKIKNFGPSTDPWGTPQANMKKHSHPISQTAVSHLSNFSPNPALFPKYYSVPFLKLLFHDWWWQKLFCLRSIVFVISSIASVIANDVNLLPYWFSASILCFSTNESDLLLNSFFQYFRELW